MQQHLRLHVKCLSEFFEVVLINSNCDYDKVCDEHQPDLVLFEGGWKSLVSEKITIKNTSSHPSIPKLGLHNGDGWCECRVISLGTWIDGESKTLFPFAQLQKNISRISLTTCLYWPNFIDDDIYKDYHSSKSIPILFTGSTANFYPWRKKNFSNNWNQLSIYYYSTFRVRN